MAPKFHIMTGYLLLGDTVWKYLLNGRSMAVFMERKEKLKNILK